MSTTVAITTLGCKTNQFESAAMEERLKKAGYQVVPFEQGAELVVVNTCTVTAATDSQSRNLIRRARRMNSACRVVVTGCYAQVDPDALRSLPGVTHVVGNEEKNELLSLLEIEGAEPVVRVSDIRKETRAAVPQLQSFSERSRAFVQIQNGCDAFCSYCIIPYARGTSRSVPVSSVVAQVRTLVEQGFSEVVLTGIHIGRYGADLEPALSLLDLVRRLVDETGVRRLRLGSMEPTEIPDELIGYIAQSEVVCPHFHIPLQAGDDEVLRRMNRHYTTAFFAELIEKIRTRIPDAAIGVDVITGFPGESDEEFSRTFNLLERLSVTHLHVFPYSRRPGTPAAQMNDQVTEAVKKDRAARLRALGESKSDEFARQFVGSELDVVVEGRRKGGSYRGLTRNYLPVRFDSTDGAEGHCLKLHIHAFKDGALVGSP